MSRISSLFKKLKQDHRQALIPYVTAGDPHPGQTLDIMHTLAATGADIIELGVPFSDPMADGPVIQQACERALAYGTSLSMVLDMVAGFRQQNDDTPVVLMGYLNPIEAMGIDTFIRRAREAGVDGVLVVDLPPEEADSVAPRLAENGIDAIFLIAPTTTDTRIESATQFGTGYIYYVSLKGVTGSNKLDLDDVGSHVQRIRDHSDLPIAVGFGIKDSQTAGAVARLADGVIVGSSLVNLIATHGDNPEQLTESVKELMQSMRQAMDN